MTLHGPFDVALCAEVEFTCPHRSLAWLEKECPLHPASDTAPGAAIITGGSLGIGLACALALAATGRSVVLLGRDPKRMAEAIASIPQPGHDRV
jgi:hypothetical protein